MLYTRIGACTVLRVWVYKEDSSLMQVIIYRYTCTFIFVKACNNYNYNSSLLSVCNDYRRGLGVLSVSPRNFFRDHALHKLKCLKNFTLYSGGRTTPDAVGHVTQCFTT